MSKIKDLKEIVEVESSTIKTIAYEGDILTIQFFNGATYQYVEVPYNIFEELKFAQSVGKYFHANIRGEFESEKIA